MRKKKIWLLSLLAIGFVVVGGYLFNAGIVWGDSERSGDKYVTDIKITDSARDVIEDGDTMEIKEVYNLDYDWEIPDNEYEEGDVLEFSIPKEFKVVNNFKFNLYDDDEEVARVDILGNPDSGYYIKMVFTTDYVETHSDVSGTFNLGFILNEKYIKTESDNTIVFNPDFEFNIYVPVPDEPGEGGSGEGAGETDASVKKGKAIQGNLVGSPDVTSTIFEWEIALGRETLLGRVDSFDQIKHIYVKDSPKEQRMVGMKEFRTAWSDAYGFDGMTYEGIPWEYGGVPEEDMGLIEDASHTYIEGFEMDILPQIKKYNEIAEENDTEIIEYELSYYSVPLNEVFEDTEFTNQAEITIVFDDDDTYTWTLDESLLYNFAEGTITGKRAGVEFKKIDADTEDGLGSAVFDLYKKNIAGDFGLAKSNIKSDENGTVKVDKLTTGEYYFIETQAPEGYELTEETLEFEVVTDDLYGPDQKLVFKDLGTFENSPESSTRDITVTKKWEDNYDQDGLRPDSITVKLYADGEEVDEVSLDKDNDWTYTWSDLDEKANGKEIVYTVEEVETIPGYEGTIVENPEGEFVITNTHVPETIDINGTKHWNDKNDQDKKRPEVITINLLADGEKIDEKTVTAATNWTYEFTNLPKYSDGYEIDYTVIESTVPDYSSEPTGEYDITNNYAPGQTSLFVIKDWKDNENQDGVRPTSIKVQLYADGEKLGEEVELNQANDWEHNWEELDEKANGKTIVYTVKEVETIPGYTVSENTEIPGTIVLINTYIPETTKIEGKKYWDDKENQDGKRPDSINVNLLADGEKVAQQAVTGPDWKYEFINIPKYSKGEVIEYTVEEETVADYTTDYDSHGKYDIENHYTPGVTQISVRKQWLDNENQDGIRPTSIAVQLFADGKKSGDQVELNQGNNWKYTWKDLDQKAGGKDIIYTVEEIDKDPLYEGNTVEKVPGQFEITNSYTPETTEIEGIKHWDDKENQDGKRPEKITVNLLADGQQVKQQEVTKDDNWAYKFTDLPKYSNGVEIKYSVVEEQVAEYSADYKAGAQFDITNHYTPGETSISVEKIWKDHNNQDGIRPTNIGVQLYANGEKLGKEVTLSDKNNWQHTWSKLDLMANGKVIEYTVEEVGKVPGYTVETDETTPGVVILTNTHTPEVTEVSGKKTWNDKNNQDGKRPETITVNLLADGEKVKEKVVTEADNWAYEFKDLPKFSEGKEIVYTVTENQVPDYSVAISGMDLTNNYTPGQTSITVTKAWDDQNDKDGIRPTSIKVQLYADGEKSGEEVTLNAKNKWTHTWDNLDEKANGKAIVYTLEESSKVDGYKTVVNNQNNGNIIITNSHTPKPDVPKPGTPKPGTPKPDTPKPGNGLSKPGNSMPKLGESMNVWTVLIGIFVLSGAVGVGVYQKASKK